MEISDHRKNIEMFIRQQFNVSPTDPNFDQQTDLFEGGYVDSVGVVEVLGYLQTEFDVEIPDSDLLSDDFATIDGMARIVCRLDNGTCAAEHTS
jgi:acyl carrier protein